MLILPVNPVASVIGPAYLSVFSKRQIVAAIVRLPTLETRKWGSMGVLTVLLELFDLRVLS